MDVPGEEAAHRESLIDLLLEGRVPAVIDASETGEGTGVLTARVLFGPDGRAIETVLSNSQVAPIADVADLVRRLESSFGSDFLVDGTHPSLEREDPEGRDRVEDDGVDGWLHSRTLLELAEDGWRGLEDAVTVAHADMATLRLLARTEPESVTMRTSSAPSSLTALEHSHAVWSVDANDRVRVSPAAFFPGAVTFLRFQKRRGFILSWQDGAVVGIWDRDIVVVDPLRPMPLSSGEDDITELLTAIAQESSEWQSVFDDDGRDQFIELRTLARERVSRSDSFVRLARILGHSSSVAELMTPDRRVLSGKRIEPATAVQVFSRGMAEQLSTSPLGWWWRLTQRRPVVGWIYTVLAAALGIGGLVLRASTNSSWWAYLVPALLLLTVVVDLALRRIVRQNPGPSDGGHGG